MIDLIRSAGFYAAPLVVLTLAVGLLFVIRAIQIFGRSAREGHALETAIHAIPFWGFVTAIVGVLGQCSGLYNAANAIANAQEISPNVIAQGFAESLSTTIWGLTVLFLSAIGWFILRAGVARRRGRARGEVG